MKLKVVFISLIIASLLSGCTQGPSCNDEQVRDMVKELVSETYKQEFLNEYYYSFKKRYPEISHKHHLTAHSTYKEWEIVLQSDTVFEPIKSLIDSVFEKKRFELNNIRLVARKDDIKECECLSNVKYENNDSTTVYYLVQHTEDGKIYVQLFDYNPE